ncbi:hypothetical protein [Pseudomonas laurylsulfatiphila]|uniref:hypothetical protein n=1 Tax=Pseudomonas laurylsulfatiphila TaxID=2011015 RepID=UPI003D212747
MPAMVVNDNACELDERGALESIAGKPAPTVLAWARSPVGAGLPAMVVNDNACELDERGALESIASKLAPTDLAWARSFVGAGLPAMVVNDYACELDKRGALESIASKLAPTVSAWTHPLWELACPRWSLTITRVNWINAAHWSPSPAGWLLQFQRGLGPL